MKYVSKNWLEQRAKTIETRNLNKHGTSRAWISILDDLYECIIEIELGKDIMIIDELKYKKIRVINLKK